MSERVVTQSRTRLRLAPAAVAGLVGCLVVAFGAVRRDDIVRHRRWMIRAFAVAIAVGTIRVWIILFTELGVLELEESFAPAFWVSFATHVLVAEWWVRTTPHPPG